MHKIVKKKYLNKEICLIEFEAIDIAKVANAGQFLIFRIDEEGERFPLTIYDWDRESGTVTVVCQAVGVSTKKLCALEEGDAILDVAGPLGHATKTENIGKVICIGGGVGTAEAYPIAKALKRAGNDVTAIIGSRNKELIICEEEMRSFCDKVYITTDDGSYGRKGFVTDVLKDLIKEQKYDLVSAVGPAIMMKMVSEMTRGSGIKTFVSLNTIMIDGTGMCGVCRLKFDGKTKFACVDGPEFDGHLVDFEDIIKRQARYKNAEQTALKLHEGKCRIGLDL